MTEEIGYFSFGRHPYNRLLLRDDLFIRSEEAFLLPPLGDNRFKMELLLNDLTQFHGNLLFPMIDEDFELRILEMGEPFEQPLLIRMGRESSQSVNTGFYRDLFSEEPNRFGSVDDPPADRPFALIPDDHDVGLRPPEVVFQMVLNASRITHPAGRNDDSGSRILVDRL